MRAFDAPKRAKRKRTRQFWASIPKASDIKITHADGTVTYEKVKNKSSAAKVIKGGKK